MYLPNVTHIRFHPVSKRNFFMTSYSMVLFFAFYQSQYYYYDRYYNGNVFE